MPSPHLSLQRRWLGIAYSIIQHYRRENIYGVSSETGVSWGLAASALLQHAKLQRRFLGAAVNGGSRSGGGVSSSAAQRQLILLFKFYHSQTLTRIALLFFFPPCRYEHLNIKYACPPPHVYVFVFEACQCKAGSLSSWYALQCKGSGYFPKKNNNKKKPTSPWWMSPICCFSFC